MHYLSSYPLRLYSRPKPEGAEASASMTMSRVRVQGTRRELTYTVYLSRALREGGSRLPHPHASIFGLNLEFNHLLVLHGLAKLFLKYCMRTHAST